MKQCPACKREVEDEFDACPFDGQPLADPAATKKFVSGVLDDKYRLEEKIGEGGMGTVYRATHIEMENSVAVKILHPHLSGDHTAVERFRREARAAAQIRHVNAVAVTDFGVTKDEGTAYLVMEFLEGGDLRGKIKQKRQLDYKEALSILNQACSAVHAAHCKGIIHRDLKPDNIWLLKSDDASERVKVLDFGIAKLKTSKDSNLTQKGMIVGTPYYMSPEQCRGEELDARSDVYSLGVILYEMLTGKIPFDGPTPLAVVLKHTTERPRPLHELRDDIPEQVESVVLRALEKKRDARQNSAIELAHEFEGALATAGFEFARSQTAPATIPFKSYPTETSKKEDLTESGRSTRVLGAPAGGRGDRQASETETVIVGAPVPHQTVGQVGPRSGPATQEGAKLTSASPSPIAERAPGRALSPPRSRARVYLIMGLIVFLLAGAIITFVLRPFQSGVTEPRDDGTPPGMVLVKGGTFKMGTDDDKALEAYKPAHDVTVNNFYLDVYEVTNEDYARFVRQTHHAPPESWKNGELDPHDAKLPVVYVSWLDAKAYADWAGKRLPTEAEWEYAARGKEGLIYPWGNEWSPLFSNSAEDKKLQPVAVGSYARGVSWCGVYDLAGNVAEWVQDDYAPYPGSKAKPDPGYKDYRGGAYNTVKEDLVTTRRWWDYPNTKQRYIGFRCAEDKGH